MIGEREAAHKGFRVALVVVANPVVRDDRPTPSAIAARIQILVARSIADKSRDLAFLAHRETAA